MTLHRCTTPNRMQSTLRRSSSSGCRASNTFIMCIAAAKDKARNMPGLAEYEQPLNMNRCKARVKERKLQDHPALCFYQCKLFTALGIHSLSPTALQETLACNFSRGAASPSDVWAFTMFPSTHGTMQG